MMGTTLPYELEAFVDHVVPILQARGRFRTEDIPAARCVTTSVCRVPPATWPMSELHFNVLVTDVGSHESAWRVTEDEPLGVLGLDHYARVARVAERGLLDSLFFADYPGLAEFRVAFMPQPHFDPIDLVSALAPLTEQIGLIATGSTTYSEPWDVARRLATLDHLSEGRAGWNIVTTADARRGRQLRHPAASRSGRAGTTAPQEYVDVVLNASGMGGRTRRSSAWRGAWGCGRTVAQLHAPRYHGGHFDVEGYPPVPPFAAGPSGPGAGGLVRPPA